MIGDNDHPFPILLLLNYWELPDSQMASRLDSLLEKKVSQIASFIPWQGIESDVTHLLTRFLQATTERRIRVYLIVTPELGLHFPNSALPKDLVSRKEVQAVHCDSAPVHSTLAPNQFFVPSLFSADFKKRYDSLLTRLDHYFSDLVKFNPSIVKLLSIILTGSFWKYYRSPQASIKAPFDGIAGDFSTSSLLTYRKAIEERYSQSEFTEPGPAAAERWKHRSMESTNQRWFQQSAEEAFRARTYQIIRRKSQLPMVEVELYTPELDPHLYYRNCLEWISGTKGPELPLSRVILDAAQRTTVGAQSLALPFVHWTSVGCFRFLSEQERQFLVLQNLLHLGPQGGGFFMDEADWFAFSPQFRNRIEGIAQSLRQGGYQFRSSLLYLSPHIWSQAGLLWDGISRRFGSISRRVASMEAVFHHPFSNILFIDPSCIIERGFLDQAVNWARAGRILVLPRSQLYTQAARFELERLLKNTEGIQFNLGLSYQLHALSEGRLVVYDLPTDWRSDLGRGPEIQNDFFSEWESFLTAMLSLGELQSYCKAEDERLLLLGLEHGENQLAVFVLNPSREAITTQLIFPLEVEIEDLAPALQTQNYKKNQNSQRSRHFTLSVPAFAVLPIAVNGFNLQDARVKQLAAMTYKETEKNVFLAATSELPGFDSQKGFGDLWS